MAPRRLILLLSLVGLAALVGVLAIVFTLRPWEWLRERPGPTIRVSASYPGASARRVAEEVAVPIEQQVAGVEGMVSLVSRCTEEGACTLDIAFKPGTDLDIAQVLVQNRVSLALPLLPEAVKKSSLRVETKGFPQSRHPIDLAVIGPQEEDARALAEQLAGRLRQSQQVTDVAISAEPGEGIIRVNMSPAVEITASPAPGVPIAEARSLCEKLAEDIHREGRLPAGCKLVWLPSGSEER